MSIQFKGHSIKKKVLRRYNDTQGSRSAYAMSGSYAAKDLTNSLLYEGAVTVSMRCDVQTRGHGEPGAGTD